MSGLVFLGIILGLVIPLINNISNIREQILVKQQEAVANEKRIIQARGFWKFSQKEESNLKKLDELLVDKQLPLDFINYLETAAADCGVQTTFSTATTSTGGEDWPALNYQVEAEGNIDNILQFTKK